MPIHELGARPFILEPTEMKFTSKPEVSFILRDMPFLLESLLKCQPVSIDIVPVSIGFGKPGILLNPLRSPS